MTEPLFRLLLFRPPVQSGLQAPAVPLAQDSSLQGALKQAATAKVPYDALRTAASAYVKQSAFIGDPAQTPLATQLSLFSNELAKLQGQDAVSKDDLIKAVKSSFDGQDPSQVSKSKGFQDTASSLKDSLLAIKQLQEEHSRPFEALSNQLRAMDLISALAANSSDADVKTGRQLAIFLERPLSLDLSTVKSVISDASAASTIRDNFRNSQLEQQATLEKLVGDFGRYHTAMGELTAVNGSHIISGPQVALPGYDAPNELKPFSGLATRAKYLSDISTISIRSLDPQGDPPAPNPPKLRSVTDSEMATASAALPVSNPEALKTISHFVDTVIGTSSLVSQSAPKYTPADFATRTLKLTTSKIQALTDGTKAVLKTEGLDLATSGLDHAVGRLDNKIKDTVRTLEITAGPALGDSVAFKTFGGTTVAISTPRTAAWTDLLAGRRIGPIFLPFPPIDTRIPHSKGKISPAGVADLLVVKQTLKSYTGADVASIENVLKSEKRSREHTTTRTTTSVTATQTETTDTETRDLESTSRFEMSKETSNTIKSDESLKAGLNVSASYGPTVKVSASVEGATSSSSNTATKSASKYSQDVTEKTAKTLTTRVLESTSLTVTDQVVEKDEHSFDNTAGQGNISGVYQWVTKLYEAQMYNYGRRVMYDFTIPEPAAFYIEVYRQAQASAVKLEQPADFTITADTLNEYNYKYWVTTVGATDVQAPPEPFKSFAKEISMPPSTDQNANFNKTDEIAIDTGYQALQCWMTCSYTFWESDVAIDVAVGTALHRFTNDGNWLFQANMNSEAGNVPLWVKTFRASQAVVGIEVKCIRTDRALDQWRVDTWGKLRTAHQARLQEYNEALAQLQLNSNVNITGKNPEANLITMRNEIKKNCISILTDQHYDLFDSIDIGANGLPEIDLFQNEAEGAYARFFEEAFEWEEMTWLTYPYYWGRKSQWPARLAFSDPDPAFEDFLKAGQCRAVAPVRPGFETAIDHFLKYGELWQGAGLPTVSDPAYVPIANEIAERLGQPQAEIPQGDAWEVRVPTSLIKLRKDDSLPKWKKLPDGTWQPDDS